MRIFAIIVFVLAAMLYVLGPWITLFLVLVPFFFAKSFLRWLSMALIVVGLGACGEEMDTDRPVPDYWTEGGIGIKVEPGASEWAHVPDLADRVDAIAIAVAEYAGYDVSELRGVVIVFRAAPSIGCAEWGERIGCTHHNPDWIDLGSAGPWVQCLEASPISHEMLHILLGPEAILHGNVLWANLAYIVEPLVPIECEFRPWTISVTQPET